MYNSLQSATPSTATILNIKPKGKLVERPYRNQKLFEMDDFDEVIVTHSEDVLFEVTIPFNTLSNADSETILGLYMDISNAYGMEYSFKWLHPKDTKTYVVRFGSNLSRTIKFNHWHRYKSFKLHVLGTFATATAILDEGGSIIYDEDGDVIFAEG